MKPNNRQPEENHAPTGKAIALGAIIEETRALFHRLMAAAKQIHKQGEQSSCRRGILRNLDFNGPQTVPQMARSRPVSRQHIQSSVNPLAEEGYVEFIDNPAHKRSKLMKLTEKGKELVNSMNRLEMTLLGELQVDVSEAELMETVAILRLLRIAFEGQTEDAFERYSKEERRKTEIEGEK